MSVVDDLLVWSGWRWMEGMRDSRSGAICVVVFDSPLVWYLDDHPCEDGDLAEEPWPDLDHFGTLGLIEHGLLREAWGPDALIKIHRWPSGNATFAVIVDDACVANITSRPYAEALVAACLAAPGRGAPGLASFL